MEVGRLNEIACNIPFFVKHVLLSFGTNQGLDCLKMPASPYQKAEKRVNTMSDTDRFKELVHYVCHHCDDTRKMGAIKLNKILWCADTYAYRLYGRTISGETAYIKRQHGPVPKRIVATLKDLEQEGLIKIREGRQKKCHKRHRLRDDASGE